MGSGNKLLKCSGGTRILQFMVEINIFDFICRPLMLFKDHMVPGWATITSWYYFVIRELINLISGHLPLRGHIVSKRFYWYRNIYEEQPKG